MEIRLKVLVLLPLIGILILTSACGLLEKQLIVKAEDGTVIKTVTAKPGLELKLEFIHSVQKTPVEEDLELDGNEWIVRRTRYKSQGVGLPFMESDGFFHREGEYFVMDDMNRRIDRLSLRTGVGTQLTIELEGEQIKLFEQFEPGTRIDFLIE